MAVAFGVRAVGKPREKKKPSTPQPKPPTPVEETKVVIPEERDHEELVKVKQKKKLPHELENLEGEITPCKPAAFMGFFKPSLAEKANEEPSCEGQISTTNPGAFMEFYKPPKWVRNCPAPRDQVYSPVPLDLDKAARLKRKRVKKSKPRGFETRRGWYCEREDQRGSKRRPENFLNYSPEELEVIRRIAQRKEAKDEAEYNEMFTSYTDGLEGKEGHIMRTMNDLVKSADARHFVKQSQLYQQWNKLVFEYIQRQIEESLDEISPDYLKDKLRWFHYQYLDAANKEMILLDYPRPGYNPFESLKHTIKYSMEFCDPVKHDLKKDCVEKRLMGQPVPEKPLVKETLPLRHWPRYHFRATLWGHVAADEEDGSEIVTQLPEKFYSHDLLYNKVFVGEYFKAEFPRGRYIVPNKGMLPENHIQKPEGKAMVWDVECQTQPRLKLWYH